MGFDEWWAGTERVPYWLNVERRQARDVWRAALEEAAKMCDYHAGIAGSGNPEECAADIRALLTDEHSPEQAKNA